MWTLKERQIFKVELAGVVLAFDPVRCLIRYQKHVGKAGGQQHYREVWERYHRKEGVALPEGTDEMLQDAEDMLYLAEAGAAIVDMPLFGTQDDPHRETDGKPSLTVTEARDVLYAYLEFATKKETGGETSTSASVLESPPSVETKEATLSTETT